MSSPRPHSPAAAAPAIVQRTVSAGCIADLALVPGVRLRLTTVERGRQLVGSGDEYTGRLSAFDLRAKLQRAAGPPATVGEYLAHARAQVVPWSDREIAAVARAATLAREALAALGIRTLGRLPPVVEVVRTTLAEEGHMAAYTRRHVIVLGPHALAPQTVAHELFHVVSRHSPRLREALYRLLDFTVVPPLRVPGDLAARVITNPDVPALDAVTRIGFDGALAHAAPLLLARRDYDGGPMGPYVDVRLVVVDRRGAGWVPRSRDGATVLLAPGEIAGFAERLGGNTAYDIHPEEVCAEHFALLLAGERQLPRPDLVAAMADVLRRSFPAQPTGADRWPT